MGEDDKYLIGILCLGILFILCVGVIFAAPIIVAIRGAR